MTGADKFDRDMHMSKLTLHRLQEVANNRVRSNGQITLKLVDAEMASNAIASCCSKINSLQEEIEKIRIRRTSGTFYFGDDYSVEEKIRLIELCKDNESEARKFFCEMVSLAKTAVCSLPADVLLGDRIILRAYDYTEGNYYEVDDFVRLAKSPSKILVLGIDHSRSFPIFVESTRKDVNAKEFRRAFSRILSWASESPNYYNFSTDIFDELIKDCKDLRYGYYIPICENRFFYRAHRVDNFLFCGEEIQGSFTHSKEPFRGGTQSDIRKLQEAFCTILMELGSLEDAVQVAVDHPGFVSPADLVKKADEALSRRNRTIAETLLNILRTYEPGHPDLPGLAHRLNRLDKIFQIQATNNFDVTAVDQMTGAEFEQLLAINFQKLGFRADTTPASCDYGADLILVTPNETRVSVQCKRFKNKVNLKAVQEVVASLSHYQCDYGIVITNNEFWLMRPSV